MKKQFLAAAFIFCIPFFIYADKKWSTEKSSGIVNVCYRSLDAVYCAGSSNKKATTDDLKHYLSVFLYFTKDDINKDDLKLHPGIVRLVKGARAEQGEKVLKMTYDYLLREGKSKFVMLSSGKDINSQKMMTETEQATEIESVYWLKYLDSHIETITCTSDGKVNLTFKITNNMKKDFFVKREDVELRIVGGRYEMLSVGTISECSALIKSGETKSFQVDVPVTGDMIPSMRYRIIPFIKNIQASKEDFSVLCEK
ncbi:MAG: hypothetical protein ACOX2F_08485 [bacterium]